MRKTIWAGMCAAVAFAAAGEARAQANLHSGDVLRPGENMIYGELGWPDAAFGWQHGLTDKVDIGVRGGLIYGYDYTDITALGLGVRVPIRITPLKRPKVSLQIHIDPGLKFDNFGSSGAYSVCVHVNRFGVCDQYAGAPAYYGYYGNGALHFGLWLDFGLEVGIHLTRDATLSVGFESPLYINLTNNPGNGALVNFPILIGPAFQYNINDSMSLGGTVKLGPSILVNEAYCGAGTIGFSCGSPLGFIVNGFFAYKL